MIGLLTTDHEGSSHAQQALDFIKWMLLEPGYGLLDLACGTGAITVPVAQAVGPAGKVFGLDISARSLDIARVKAEKAGVAISFLEHDMTKLHYLQDHGIKEDVFDVITCASAFMLLQDPESHCQHCFQ